MLAGGGKEEESIAAWDVSPAPRYCSGLQQSLPSCKQTSTKGKSTVQLARHPAAAAPCRARSPALLPSQKGPSVTLLPTFLPSTRADICFPRPQAESSSAPAPRRPNCSPGGEEEGRGAVPCAPTGTPVPGDQQQRSFSSAAQTLPSSFFTDTMPNNHCPTPPGGGRVNSRVQGLSPPLHQQ